MTLVHMKRGAWWLYCNMAEQTHTGETPINNRGTSGLKRSSAYISTNGSATSQRVQQWKYRSAVADRRPVNDVQTLKRLRPSQINYEPALWQSSADPTDYLTQVAYRLL